MVWSFRGEGETKTDDVYVCVVYPTLLLLSAGQKHIFLTRPLQKRQDWVLSVVSALDCSTDST